MQFLCVGNEEHTTSVFKERFKTVCGVVKARHPEITVKADNTFANPQPIIPQNSGIQFRRLCFPAPSRSMSSFARPLSQISAAWTAPTTRAAKFTVPPNTSPASDFVAADVSPLHLMARAQFEPTHVGCYKWMPARICTCGWPVFPCNART